MILIVWHLANSLNTNYLSKILRVHNIFPQFSPKNKHKNHIYTTDKQQENDKIRGIVNDTAITAEQKISQSYISKKNPGIRHERNMYIFTVERTAGDAWRLQTWNHMQTRMSIN